MAEQADIDALRVLINEPDATVYTDEALGARIDDFDGDLNSLAGTIWSEKAGRFAALVDVTEGSSSRKLGSLYTNALAMAKFYGEGGASGVTTSRGYSRTRPIERQ